MLKRITVLSFLFLAILGVSAQSFIIWNFDSPATSPSAITRLGYFYVYSYSTVAGKGIAGSNALEITVPALPRTWGGGLIAQNSSRIDLTSGGSNTTQSVYWSIMANETSTFGVAFEVTDTTGNKFIPPGVLYTGDSEQFSGSISTTAFQKVTWNVASFAYYKYVYSPLTVIRDQSKHPLLSAISTMAWIFPTNILSGSTSGAGSISNQPELTFYLDNVGATKPTVNTTGLMYQDWSIFSQAVVPTTRYEFPGMKEKNLILDK